MGETNDYISSYIIYMQTGELSLNKEKAVIGEALLFHEKHLAHFDDF